ncbi:MAG: hypothetical protein QM673_12280 [Gordonia sp. (in: high G+C Gram-positive bacteria)]
MKTSIPLRRRPALAALAVAVMMAAGCASKPTTSAEQATSVPRSAAVTVTPGASVRTPPGTALNFGASAVLPAFTYHASGPLALYTVTGITVGKGMPSSQTHGGTPWFLYVTVTSLSPRRTRAPEVTGLAGSADGHTAALTLPPATPLADCPANTPPQTMRRGESYATCLVAYADPGQKLRQVIYWADTASSTSLNYKRAPVAWRDLADTTSSTDPKPST